MQSKKKHLVFGLFCAIIIFSASFVFLNYQTKTIVSIEYDNADEIIEKSIKDGFKSIFPEESFVPKNSHCNFSACQPLLGEDSYFIELECSYSAEVFQKEQERIKNILQMKYWMVSNRVMYTTNHFEKDLITFFDEDILDGQTYFLQLVVFDESDLSVYYFLSLQRDQNPNTYVRQKLQELNTMIEL